MPTNVSPQTLQRAVQAGFKRLENFRRARLMYMRNYVGPYYDKDHGRIATEPLNMIFNAIRVLVPNIVMKNPEHEVGSELPYRDYAELLELAMDVQARDLKLTNIYRQWLVDAIFTMGILKTGLCESSRVIAFNEDDQVDPGSVFTEVVDLDDLTFAPNTKKFENAAFIGDRIDIPRYQLLDSGLYRNDLIERLPSLAAGARKEEAAELSRRNINQQEAGELADTVQIVELWIPQAKAIVTVPAADMNLEEYLRVTDYYGPDSGPYTFLKLTAPPSNNPMPVAPVGIWNDLHIMGNRMAHKILTQADRQKDIVAYRRASADDAQEVVDAKDGEAVAVEDPQGIATLSFGGQNRSNEACIDRVQMWFNLMSGNTEALGGTRESSGTATQAEILQANSSVGIEDMRTIVYDAAGEEAAKRAWYLHTDPLIEVPLIKRVQVPAKFSQSPMGAQMIAPARIEDQQVILTPAARRGDFLDFHFNIKLRSMSRIDPRLQGQGILEFLVKGIPAAVQAAQLSASMGVGLSFPKLVIRLAKDVYGIDWLDEVFYDPEFQEMMMAMMQQTPGMEGSQGQSGASSSKALRQNGQPSNLPAVASPQKQSNQLEQQGAVPAQKAMQTNDVI